MTRWGVARPWGCRLAAALVWGFGVSLMAGGAAWAQGQAGAAPAASSAPATPAASAASAASMPTTLPSFQQLQAQGARIGQIRIAARDIFDLADAAENNALFRLANRLHISSRAAVIENALLFKRGDAVDVRLIEETERLLRQSRFLYDVQIRAVAVNGNVVDVEVLTRDTWSLDPGISASRTGGANGGGIQLNEYNLLGTGTTLGVGRSRGVDRTGTEWIFANERLFGSRTSLALSHTDNSDGRRSAVSLVQPFYALDTRWAAGLNASSDDRIDAIYNAGEVSTQYRHRLRQAEAFAGWSSGLRDGWVQRLSVGLALQEDEYLAEPGLVAPARLPAREQYVAPFVRVEWLQDRFERELNRNLIGRPEFFALGLAANLQLGYAVPGFGSTARALLFQAGVSRGFEPFGEAMLMTSLRLKGRWQEGQLRRQWLGGRAQLYVPQSRSWLFYVSASGDAVARPNPDDLLTLGGDNGLRGYPLRYQVGHRRALFTVEERFFTDIYLWRLFRFGGAAFVDVGRAWGGDHFNAVDAGWLGNAGVGLRIVSARSAFSNVLHVDLAFPLGAQGDIRKMQLLVKTRASF